MGFKNKLALLPDFDGDFNNIYFLMNDNKT